MKKSFIKALVAMALVFVTVFALASCDMLPESITGLIGGGKNCAHSNVEWVIDTPATCKLVGTQHSVCADCGKIVESNVPTEKGDHAPGDWEIKTEANCIREGTKVRKCTFCKKDMESETIPMLTTHAYDYGKCTVCKIDQPASSGLQFVSNGDGTCTVGGIGSCADTSLVIPEKSPAGDTVTAIAASAFKDNASITSLILPTSLTSVGSNAFSGCPIVRAKVPVIAVASVKSTYITELVVTGSGKIADGAMQGAKSLRALRMEEGVTAVGENSFNGTALVSISMPSTLHTIGAYAFANNDNLNTVVIGSGVVEICEGAFNASSFIYNVTISASVVKIGNKAFYQCPRIGSAVFENPNGWTIKDGGGSQTAEYMSNTTNAASVLKGGKELTRS